MIKTHRDNLIASAFIPATQRDILMLSERQLLGQVFRSGSATQAELTANLPLSQQSISRMTSALEQRGLLRRGSRKTNGQRGQPSAEVFIQSNYAYSIGLSLTARGMSATLVDFSGQVKANCTPSLKALKKEEILYTAKSCIKTLFDQANADVSRLFSVGLAVSGFRVGNDAIFNTPESLDDFALTDLEDLFSKSLGIPVWAENDGKAATLAENMNGVGRTCSNFAYFYIATGVGGGVVIDGKLETGVRGNAGEFVGVLPIKDYPFPNLELLRQMLADDSIEYASVEELVQNYDPSWPTIDVWIKRIAPSLSLMASATSAILDTDRIVLGGLLPHNLAMRMIPEIQFFDIGRRKVVRQHAEIVPAQAQENATAVGAALLPFADKFFEFC